MDSIKVLIIAQNILVRRAITNTLKKFDVFEVCWMAENFEEIPQFIEKNRPDVILLNIDDMNSDGITILSTLRMKFPALPVIAVTPRSDKGAEAAINALRLGALDFISKPEHKNLILFAERHLKKRLEPIIKAAKKMKERKGFDEQVLKRLGDPQKTFDQIGAEPQSETPAEIVVIGGCTGGAQALFSLVGALPGSLKVPVVIVQHLPRMYTSYLAQKLNAISDATVREVQDGVSLDTGDIWIAPGGYQCEVGLAGYQKVLKIHRGMRENDMRPSIDTLFRSSAKVYGKKTLGILLSGCTYDGLTGAEEIKKQGGQILVQDPRTSIAAELPLTAIKKGLTDEYYSPEELARQIVRRGVRISQAEAAEEQGVGNSLYF